VEQVQKVVTGTIDGVKVVLGDTPRKEARRAPRASR